MRAITSLVVPIYFASHERQLYTFARLGEKIQWMRANPRVCVEVDELITRNQWISVVVVGHYEEFPDTPEYQLERNRAYELLQRQAMWWPPAYVASANRGAADPLIPIFFCIHIDRVTGHHAMLDSVEAATLAAPGSPTKSESWLSRLMRRARIS